MRRTSLPALRTFERVVTLGSQTAAAADLGVTQTAVSHAVRSLEAQVGTRLFERSARGSVPTRAGAALAAELAPAFAGIDRAVARLTAEAALACVSVTPAFAACWLAPRLAEAAAEGRPVALTIHASTLPLAFPGAEAALAVRYAEAAAGQHLTQEVFRAVTGAQGDSNSLPNLPLIETCWARGEGFAPVWRDWFDAAGLPMPPDARVTRVPDEHQALQAALAGGGVALLSDVLTEQLVARSLLRVVRPRTRVAGLSYWLLIDEARAEERAVREAARWIRAQFAAADSPMKKAAPRGGP